MAKFSSDAIRNICLLGHGGDGKTSIAEAMLYLAKATDRLGKIADGNTVCDFDPEEIKRGFSLSASLAHFEWKGKKINLLDTPGYFDFAGEVQQAVAVAGSAIIVLEAKGGVKVGAELAWDAAASIPKAFFVNKMDDENADFDAVFQSLREKFGKSVCPVIVPYGKGAEAGYYNLLQEEAYTFDKTGARTTVPLPDAYKEKMAGYQAMIFESLAETSEELMEKFFAEEPFTSDEMETALNRGLCSGDIAPVFCGSAVNFAGLRTLLNYIASSFASPVDRCEKTVVGPDGETTTMQASAEGAPSLFVFKTVADAFGKKTYFKVMNGTLKKDAQLINLTTGQTEKISRIVTPIGKTDVEADELAYGDIGYTVKLVNTNTNDTLAPQGWKYTYPKIEFPRPYLCMAISPKAKGDEDKIATGIAKLLEEDLTIRYENNAETKQMCIYGLGEMHIDVITSKLKNRFGTTVTVSPAKVPYRETIKKKVQVEGKHKKQSGGHGQYGHVKIEFSPGDTDGLEFTETIFGGSVPKNFHPAVEKGLQESMAKGVLAGYPVIGIKANLFDGSYHDVDSSEMSFKLAANLAFKEGMKQGGAVLLEPVGELRVSIPTSYSGDIMGDISKRRGRIMGMSESGRKGFTVIEAEVPSAEMGSYAIQLRAMTQGRGSYSFAFVRYEEAPAEVAAKVIEAAKKEAAAE